MRGVSKKVRQPRTPLTPAEREARLDALRQWASATYHAKQAALFRRHGMDWRADYHEQRAKEAQ